MNDTHTGNRQRQLISSFCERFKEEEVLKLVLNLFLLRLAGFESRKQEEICLPPDLEWEQLKKQQNGGLRERICQAMYILNEADSGYRGLVEPECISGDFDDGDIYKMFELIDAFFSGSSGDGSDLTELFERILGCFAMSTARQTGAYNTPRRVADLIAELLDPKGGILYDPCCGSAGMLVCVAEYMKKRNRSFQLYGQEASETAWKTARINLMLRGMEADLGAAPADLAEQDVHTDLKADYVLGNPPFHGYGWSQSQLNERQWKYGTPSAKRTDFAWLQHMLYHLKEEGKMGAVFSNGILASRRTQDRKIRAALLKEDMIEAVIALPSGIFFNTKVSASLWILCKKKSPACKGRILLMDAGKSDKTTKRKPALLPDPVREKIIQAYGDYQNGTVEDQEGFCRQISVSEIETENYSLAPERYLVRRRQEISGWDELKTRERGLGMRLTELMDKNRETLNQIVKKKQEKHP